VLVVSIHDPVPNNDFPALYTFGVTLPVLGINHHIVKNSDMKTLTESHKTSTKARWQL